MFRTLLVVLILVVFLDTLHGKDVQNTPVSDMSLLQSQFQSILNELGNKQFAETDDTSLATLLSRLEKLQQADGRVSQNISSLEWFNQELLTPGTESPSRPLRITIVVSSFEGMYLNSGIGTFYAALADFLVNHGHNVTILYTRPDAAETKTFTRWQSTYERRGINVVRLHSSSVHIAASSLVKKSYQVYNYLKEHEQEFDLVHFPDFEGPAYFSVLARHQGLAFESKLFITGLHGPWRWVQEGNRQYHSLKATTDVEDLETDYLERRSVELSDIVWTPSIELAQWLIAQGWSLPEISSGRLFLMPFLAGREINQIADSSVNLKKRTSGDVRELVFFGRLEQRKGLDLFADALDTIAMERPEFRGLKVTFLGRTTTIGEIPATSYLDQRAERGSWPFKVDYITHKDRKGALDYLRVAGRLAVIPSIVENAPYTVYECLYAAVPFISTDLPSISALVHPEDRSRVLVPVDATSLAAKLESALDNGATPARSSLDAQAVQLSWQAFYGAMSAKIEAFKHQPITEKSDDFTPLVSVCITHFNRPQFLSMVLKSIQSQDYQNIEVVVVDDGSTTEDAISYLNSLENPFQRKGWKIVRTANQYLGAARNTAVRNSRGDYVLFLDDDNIARTNSISTYVEVAHATGSDLFTAIHDVFSGTGFPVDETDANTNIVHRSLFLGPSVTVGLFKNCFGDANFFIKRSIFEELGGFTEERDIGQEDHEFLAKAVLKGYLLEAIPEPLLFYRMHNKEQQMIFTTDPIKNQLRASRPFTDQLKDNANSGEAVLKVLARHRLNNREVNTVPCNLTITTVYPEIISILSNVELTFSVTGWDCDISTVLLGSGSSQYACTDFVKLSNTSFQVISPMLPLPGSYRVFIQWNDTTQPVLPTDKFITAVWNETGPTTSALMGLKIAANPPIYSQTVFRNFLADLVSVEHEWFVFLQDVFTGQQVLQDKRSMKQAAASLWDVRDQRLLIISRSSTRTATDLVYELLQLLTPNKDGLYNIGVIILEIHFLGACDLNGICECTPNYVGPQCDIPADCPNNCSQNGVCIDGPYNRICQCYETWTGRDCSIGLCPGDCSGHGACVLHAGQPGVCVCDGGWTGTNCSTVVPCPNNCGTHGQCVDGVCQCDAGWTNDDCGAQFIEDDQVEDLDDGMIPFAVVVAVVGAILLTAIAIGIYLIVRRRRNY